MPAGNYNDLCEELEPVCESLIKTQQAMGPGSQWFSASAAIVSTMKGKIFMTLFALPFFGTGVWMLWSVSNAFVESYQMQSWIQVEARLLSGGYNTLWLLPGWLLMLVAMRRNNNGACLHEVASGTRTVQSESHLRPRTTAWNQEERAHCFASDTTYFDVAGGFLAGARCGVFRHQQPRGIPTCVHALGRNGWKVQGSFERNSGTATANRGVHNAEGGAAQVESGRRAGR